MMTNPTDSVADSGPRLLPEGGLEAIGAHAEQIEASAQKPNKPVIPLIQHFVNGTSATEGEVASAL